MDLSKMNLDEALEALGYKWEGVPGRPKAAIFDKRIGETVLADVHSHGKAWRFLSEQGHKTSSPDTSWSVPNDDEVDMNTVAEMADALSWARTFITDPNALEESEVIERIDNVLGRVVGEAIEVVEESEIDESILGQYHCTQCGSTIVHSSQWFDLNTGEPVDADSPVDNYFCESCDNAGRDGDIGNHICRNDGRNVCKWCGEKIKGV